MLKVSSWGESPRVLQAVWRVKSGAPAVAGYYVKINDCLYSTRPAGTPQGYALWRLSELPTAAEPEPKAAPLLGREVRRVLLAERAQDDTQMAFVLDLGQQNYLEFYEAREDAPALSMNLSPDCGKVEHEMTLVAELPATVELPEKSVRSLRLGIRVMYFGVALIVAGFISLLAGVDDTPGAAVILSGFVLAGAGRWLSARFITCPWCGEKKMSLASGCSYFVCEHCSNSVDLESERK